MRPRSPSTRNLMIAIVVTTIFAWPGSQRDFLRPGPAVYAEAATQPAPQGPTTMPADGGWPRHYTTRDGARFILYQPQVESWADQKHAVMYSAVSYTSAGAQKPTLGVIKIECDTSVSLEERLVNLTNLAITASSFPTLQRDDVRNVVAAITATVPLNDRVLSLDRVLANVNKSQIVAKNTDGVRAEPPPIFFSTTPAIVVNLDGQPIWSPIPDNDLKSAVNTNWDLFQDTGDRYYLRDDDVWLTASAVMGPWTPAGTLPSSFQKLPANDNWQAVKASLPGKVVRAAGVPRVFVSFKPAELILLDGAPKYVPVPGAPRLLWVSNTESDVFRMGRTGLVYFLASGRWFSSPGFNGPWTFATPDLPRDFKSIPLEHPRSRVLASVPGTDEAIDAVLLAGIPHTARVSRSLQAPAVGYQGMPDFVPIENTTIARAVNTDKDVFKVGSLYYMCLQGVWFMAASPEGPWSVTGAVPQEIYEIPISSPAYPVTYVTVGQSTDDDVWFSTAAEYTGLMVAWGCAVWGTGYYYPPFVHYGAIPAYFPYYPTYGYGALYNPWTGSYARGAVAYGPYGGAGVGARYNPITGMYARGAAAWGPYGGAAAGRAYNPRTGTMARGAEGWGPGGRYAAAQAYNPRTGGYGATRQGSNVYGNWGTTAVQRGDQWATTSHVTNRATGATTRAAQGSGGAAAVTRSGPVGTSFAGQTRSGDLYAGHDGNVYRNTGGGWQKYGDGSWNSVQSPRSQPGAQYGGRIETPAFNDGFSSLSMNQLSNDWSARNAGQMRADEFSGLRDSGAWGSGSFRPSAGGFGGGFGGGGFRGGFGGGRR